MSSGSSLTASGLSGFVIPNGKIVPTISGGALTIKIVNAEDDSDPSPTKPLFTAFPSDQTSGAAFAGRAITSPLSITVPSGATLGYGVGGVPLRTWLALVYDGTTFQIGVQNCSAGGVIRPLLDRLLQTSTAVSTGSDSSGLLYTGAAVTSQPIRLLGFLDWTSGLAVPGVWDVLPDIRQMYFLGITAPGSVVQEFCGIFANISLDTNTNTIPFDDTPPQSSEGNTPTVDTLSLTPTSKANWIIVEYFVSASYSVAAHIIAAIFNGGSDAIAARPVYTPGADEIVEISVKAFFLASSVSQMTFTIKIGGSTAGTLTLCGAGSARKLGGVQARTLHVKEIMG